MHIKELLYDNHKKWKIENIGISKYNYISDIR